MLPIRSANRRRLDRHLAGLGDQIGPRPPRGWIREVREALGMSTYELGARLGVTASNVSQHERAEAEGRIQLATLERVAEALNCRLCYVLAPQEPLERMARRQALDKAARVVGARAGQMDTSQDCALLAEAIAEEIERLANELINQRSLWRSD
jgi:predicted DNA-binding mobile mystery protein A